MPRNRPSLSGPTATPPPRTKDETYWKILNAAVILDIRHGHQRWTMTQLARSSGVSRTLVYYYFGKSKQDILNEAVALFGSELSGMAPWRLTLWEQGRLAETFHETRRIYGRVPALLPFFLLHRGLDTEIGRAIRRHEGAFRSKIARFFPDRPAADREVAFALFFGVSFAPEVSDEGVSRAIAWFMAGAGKSRPA
jgi:AcrR family transcriptional regulator